MTTPVRRWLLVALASLGVRGITSARGATLEVDAGALRAAVEADPWRLVFYDADGRPVLAEATERGPGPSGAVGFRTAAGWVHATRALAVDRHGRALVVTLETNDSLGRRLGVRIERDADGVIALEPRLESAPTADVEALGIGFEATADERFFGLG
jgi:hypothetical protein